jgi:hypothetical protein
MSNANRIIPAEAREAAIRNPTHHGARPMTQEITSLVTSHISLQTSKTFLQPPAILGFLSRFTKAAPKTVPITMTLTIFGAAKGWMRR